MRTIASARGWAWPVLSGAMAVLGVTVLALVHGQLDLATYLLGGAHAASNNLFSVTYPADHLGFTYPPFSALLFAPFAHLPVRVCEVVFSCVNLAALFGLLAVSLRAVCRRARPPQHPLVGPRLVAPGGAVRPGAPDVPPRAGQHHPLPHGRGRLDHGPAGAPGCPGRLGGCHQGDAAHPHPVPLHDAPGPGRHASQRLVLRRRVARRRRERVDIVVLLDALHPRPAAGGHALVGGQPGHARRARAGAGPYRHDVDHLRRRGECRR